MHIKLPENYMPSIYAKSSRYDSLFQDTSIKVFHFQIFPLKEFFNKLIQYIFIH